MIRRPFFVRLLATTVILYTAAVGYLYYNQNKLLYFPAQESFDDCDLGERHKISELLRFHRVSDGSQPKKRIAYFHGNASSACRRGQRIKQHLVAPGIEVHFVEYPGFAEKNREPTQVDILKAATEWVTYASKDPDVKLIFMGESLGTGVATYASTLIENEGLILFSPYNSIADVGLAQYPFIPVRWIMRDVFDAQVWAPRSKSSRAIIFHGEQDEVIPIDLAHIQRKNFNIPIEFIPYANRGHNDLTRDNNHLWSRIKEFIR